MGIRDWFRARGADEREVREEIVFHLDRATQENIARGMGPEEARAEALRRFGDMEQVRRDCMAARGRGVPRFVAWSAVAALAVASFLGGYAVRSDGGVTRSFGTTVEYARPPVAWRLGGLEPLAARRSVLVEPATISVHGLGLPFPSPSPASSPFTAWRWRDGTPEVKLDGDGWYALVSAAGVPAATLREEHRKAQGLPEGVYIDGDPFLMGLGSKRCKAATMAGLFLKGATTIEFRLRSLADGRETRVACAGAFTPVKRIPASKRPKVVR
jgi:hypothetical protein